MGVNLATKTLSTFNMRCSDTAQITLSLTASNDVHANPADIVLVLDRSGSMRDKTEPDNPSAPTKITALKEAAKIFTQIIANASTDTTPPPDSDEIADSTIGVVSFAASARIDLTLNQRVSVIDAAIDALNANGNTNHAEAFRNARDVLDTGSNARKYLILITDGLSTAPPPSSTALAQANTEAAITRDEDIIIYGIGLGADASQANLETWTGDPERVLMAPSTAELEEAFRELAAAIINPAPENITVVDTLEDNFEIVEPITTLSPTGVTADYEVSNNNKTITWTLDSLGVPEPQTASITFSIRYTGTESGTFDVNKSITYDDSTSADPSKVKFITNGNKITVDCDQTIIPDCNYACKTVDIPCCTDTVNIVMPNSDSAYDILCDGTILNVVTRFRNVCPNRKLIIGIIVCSTLNGEEEAPIHRVTTIDTPSTQSSCECQDFEVPIEVLLPPSGHSCSDQRQIKVRVIAHYLSTSVVTCHACPDLDDIE